VSKVRPVIANLPHHSLTHYHSNRRKTLRFNNDLLQQASEQQRIRRGQHEWKSTGPDDQHGIYVEKPYVYQEYPKMMGKWPRPEYKQFLRSNGVEVPADKAHERYEAAVREWSEAMSGSVVNSAAEEQAWLRKNK
jgi:hypothetical protein